ncbi:MAG: hydroxylamine oxidase [Desulfobacterales bacterium]|nr:MAG: hydroxylamine oxidase [Desulfobacterales bacterium]
MIRCVSVRPWRHFIPRPPARSLAGAVLSGIFSVTCLMPSAVACAARAPVSEATETCLGCHSSVHPGIVEDWQRSRHARITPETAMAVSGPARKVSAQKIPAAQGKVAVGCAECHTANTDLHPDTFDHHEFPVHSVVSPPDCALCHPVEAGQYGRNMMSRAHGNLNGNPLYRDLERTIIGLPERKENQILFQPPDTDTRAESCLYCHGTRLEAGETRVRDTVLGEMPFPEITGWPNQGVGRINPDGSEGACSACHPRHEFSMETARKPETCGQCHAGPDVPSHKVYQASKHGVLHASLGDKWNYTAVPWTIGQDFSAPTCAVCHISGLVDTDGAPVATRSHEMTDRLPWRIFGLIYAHPWPRNPDTAVIRNKSGLPLPTDLDGTPADEFLIDGNTRERRTEAMQSVCNACHTTSWTTAHWRRFENTIHRSNADVAAATSVMREIWKRGYAKGPDQEESPFDEAVERQWTPIWLFYANTVRFASAMGGGGDYAVFAQGRHQLSRQIVYLEEWLRMRRQLFPSREPTARLRR